jgi:hypothetical protein
MVPRRLRRWGTNTSPLLRLNHTHDPADQRVHAVDQPYQKELTWIFLCNDYVRQVIY